MEEILASVDLGNGRSVHIAQLSRQTLIDADAEHLGFGGYYLFETIEGCLQNGISVLGKVSSMDAAFRMVDIMTDHFSIKRPMIRETVSRQAA